MTVSNMGVPAPPPVARRARGSVITRPFPQWARFTKDSSGGVESLLVPAANPVQILSPNEGRTAGQVTNMGSFPVFLYLAPLADLQHIRPALWLGARGSVWNFQLSNVIWGGTVCAQAIGADTTLAVIEL